MTRLPTLKISEILKRYDIRPTKKLGQNFLVNDGALMKIIESANIMDDELVLEIGPGLGSLTRYLAHYAKRVVAVEIDERFLPALRDTLEQTDNVKLLNKDIMKMDIDRIIISDSYLVVANIPYNLTSRLIRKLLEASNKPSRIILTVQKEVAERICADGNDMSILALSVQVYGKPSIKASISAGSFFPAPSVDSSVIRIDLYDSPLVSDEQLKLYFSLIKAGFGNKRKKLRNSLSSGMGWSKTFTEKLMTSAKIDFNRRAQTLSIVEWINLTQRHFNN